MREITITKEMLAAARDYVPSAEKRAFLERSAEKCVETLSIRAGEEQLPAMFMPDHEKKARFLMGALAGLYFGMSFETDAEGAMTEADFDRWAGSHVFGQLDRLKSDRELRDKCFDLLNDYASLEKRLTGRIAGLLNAQNDAVVRQALVNQRMAEKLAENAKSNQVQIAELRERMAELKRLRAGTADGADNGG